jgi:hypothetical protein
MEPTMPDNTPTDLDKPVWGARAIAAEAGLIDEETGEPDVVRAQYLLGAGLLPADKVGRAWTSTPRRLRSIASGEHLKT